MADLDTQFQILQQRVGFRRPGAGGPCRAGHRRRRLPPAVAHPESRTLAKGARQAGWKVGQTNRALREERGESMPAPGFLLETDRHASGVELELGDGDPWFLEPEMAVSARVRPGWTGCDARSRRAVPSRQWRPRTNSSGRRVPGPTGTWCAR